EGIVKQLLVGQPAVCLTDLSVPYGPSGRHRLSVYLVNIKRLLNPTFKSACQVAGIPAQDLVHALAALYDVALGSMETEIIYSTVSGDNTYSLVAVREPEEALAAAEARAERALAAERKKLQKQQEESSASGDPAVEPQPIGEALAQARKALYVPLLAKYTPPDEAELDHFEPEPERTSDFVQFYSSDEDGETGGDGDGEWEDEDDDDDEDDFSVGYRGFIRRQLESRIQFEARAADRIKAADGATEGAPESSTNEAKAANPAVVDRLAGAATFDLKTVEGERVVHLVFLAVRSRFRRAGLGSALLRSLKDPAIVGRHSAVVVHADPDAVSFFARWGFITDPVMNEKWKEFADQFYNCTIMSYHPPWSAFAPDHPALTYSPRLEAKEMERQFFANRAQQVKSLNSQTILFERMRHELAHLRLLVQSRDDLIRSLTEQLRLATGVGAEGGEAADGPQKAASLSDAPESAATVEKTDPAVPARWRQAAARIERGLNSDPRAPNGRHRVIAVREPATALSELWRQQQQQQHAQCTQLYLCGPRRAEACEALLERGFTGAEHMEQGAFGLGFYLSPSPLTAALYAPSGMLLLVWAALGATETVVSPCRGRAGPSAGYQSLLCPGRSAYKGDDNLAREYLVFDPRQLSPCLLVLYKDDAGDE
ncbi:hypothetical protein BOX15_Mlig018772g2, partial [Macrostomum lignano]